MGFVVKARNTQKMKHQNSSDALEAAKGLTGLRPEQLQTLLRSKAFDEEAFADNLAANNDNETLLKLQSYTSFFKNWHKQLAWLNFELNDLRALFDESHSRVVNVETLHQAVAQWKQTPGALFGYGCNPPQAFDVAGQAFVPPVLLASRLHLAEQGLLPLLLLEQDLSTLKQWLQQVEGLKDQLETLLAKTLVTHNNKEAAQTGARSQVKKLSFFSVKVKPVKQVF